MVIPLYSVKPNSSSSLDTLCETHPPELSPEEVSRKRKIIYVHIWGATMLWRMFQEKLTFSQLRFYKMFINKNKFHPSIET